MNYEDMTTSQIKKKLIEIMSERESEAYVFGWLRSAYIHQYDEDIERSVAIKQLKQYEAVK